MRRLFFLSICLFPFSGLLIGCAGGASQVPDSANSASSLATPLPSPTPDILKEEVHFQSDGLKLVGYVFKPRGAGPFPAIVWNHGSEPTPDQSQEFDAIADVFVPAGYVVFAPVRRGQGTSEGKYLVDATEEYGQTHTHDETGQWLADQFTGPQLDDQLAGLAYLKSFPFVNQDHLAVMGCSYGAIETLFGAEHPGTGYKTAVALSPAAESWNSLPLQQRLLTATLGINIPTFLIHPAKDVNLEPGYALGHSFQDQQKAYSLKIYPPFGPDHEQNHCFGGPAGNHVWAKDVLEFIKRSI